MKVLFYISGHGFGHATRIISIMQALMEKEPRTWICAATRVPRQFFAFQPEQFMHRDIITDVGVIEKDLFSQDIFKTLDENARILFSKEVIISTELDFISREGIDLIVSDIPPLASEIGNRAGVPVVAIGNFSWDFIYDPYVQIRPEFGNIVREIRSCYEKTDLLLRLPFHHEMEAFPRILDVPLVARKAVLDREEVRSRLGISPFDARPIILIAVRMHDVIPPHAVEEILKSREFLLLSFDPLPTNGGCDVRIVGDNWRRSDFPSILAASDVVVSKLGYGIVSECLAGKTRLMHVDRDYFAEYQVLLDGIQPILPSYLMPREDFVSGNWLRHVRNFVSAPCYWPDVQINGAEVIADLIISEAYKK